MSVESSSFTYRFTGKRPISEPERNTKWVLKSQVKPHIYPNKSRHPSTLCLATGNGGFSQTYRIGDRDGVVIVDHGSRRKESNLMLDEFVAMFRDKTGYPIVEPAHMDIPSLTAEAAKEHQGVSYIITAPLGLHELLVDVVNDRIKHCLDHVAGDVDECSVCAGTNKCRLY
ncbi:sirohydrochlorin ferrochelatase, chloroplastic isoform X2 [Diospyros lotus]|uniref:sirohydrochlorin ferrochelatase, chloroplastic isoform X2 n=1 Tax=Diospyros lotus TaxID=55363 RepID=UPI0022536D65|nr:sirohydrochlorin ferrochelatase, chloroplastic isoform X2 [Diospyros lotus]